jgi:hypothetical protein
MLTGVSSQPGAERRGVCQDVRTPQRPADGASFQGAREAPRGRVDPRAAPTPTCPIDHHPLTFEREPRELRLSGPRAAADARPDGHAHGPTPSTPFAFSASSIARSFASSSR